MPKLGFEIILVTLCLAFFIFIGINLISGSFGNKGIIPAIAYLLLLFSGSYFSFLKDIKNEPLHILQHSDPFEGYLAVVLGSDEPKPNSIANRVSLLYSVKKEGKFPLKGEVIIYHRAAQSLQPGDVLLINGMPQLISPPTNPKEFNYQEFMFRQQISHQHFIHDRFQRLGTVNVQPMENFFLHIRAKIMALMDQRILDSQANQVAKALLLGQKKNMDKDLSNAYAATGAMHILAVSGLHVGIVYGFFFLLIKPYKLPTGKRVPYLSLIILLIWSYAFLTGMSPSVMRAATMFSLMALAQMKSRNPSIFNAIALSALLLLVFDPFLIYAVGFQLSYAALLGIILFQPILVNLWLPKNKILEYCWQITTVGIAAQMATFPISVYYFHMFPTYFILSNIIAIPGAFLIMSFGIPFMLLGAIPYISAMLAWLVENSIMVLNKMIFFVQRLPNAQLNDLQIDKTAIVVYVAVLMVLYLLVTLPKKWNLYLVVFIIMGFGMVRVFIMLDPFGEKQLIIYDSGGGIAFDFLFQKGSFYFQNGVRESDLSYKVNPNRQNKNPLKEFALKAFDVQDSIKIFLPDIKGDITFFGDKIKLSPNLEMKSVQQWKKGNWQDWLPNEPVYPKTNAVKIILK